MGSSLAADVDVAALARMKKLAIGYWEDIKGRRTLQGKGLFKGFAVQRIIANLETLDLQQEEESA